MRVEDITGGSTTNEITIYIYHLIDNGAIFPIEISNLYMWYNIDNISMDYLLSDTTTKIETWKSAINPLHKLITPNKSPVLIVNDGFGYVNFSRSNNTYFYTEQSLTPPNTSYSFCIVYRTDNFVNNKLYTLISLNDDYNHFSFFMNDIKVGMKIQDKTGFVLHKSTIPIKNKIWNIIIFILKKNKTNTLQMSINGKMDFEKVIKKTLPIPKSIGVGVFGSNNNAYNDIWDADMAEILIYNKALTLTETKKIEKYLSNKFNITLD